MPIALGDEGAEPEPEPVSVRIGLHTGPCVSGILSLMQPKLTISGVSPTGLRV